MLIKVKLSPMQWAETCVALRNYIQGEAGKYPQSRKDALEALRRIDAVCRGSDTLAPPDDLL